MHTDVQDTHSSAVNAATHRRRRIRLCPFHGGLCHCRCRCRRGLRSERGQRHGGLGLNLRREGEEPVRLVLALVVVVPVAPDDFYREVPHQLPSVFESCRGVVGWWFGVWDGWGGKGGTTKISRFVLVLSGGGKRRYYCTVTFSSRSGGQNKLNRQSPPPPSLFLVWVSSKFPGLAVDVSSPCDRALTRSGPSDFETVGQRHATTGHNFGTTRASYHDVILSPVNSRGKSKPLPKPF